MTSVPIMSMTFNLPSKSDNLGGPFQGYSPQQTLGNFKDAEQSMTRRILRDSWNTQNARGTVNGHSRIITPYRAVNNLGDFLGRIDYVCGGANEVNRTFPGRQGPIRAIMSHCDQTGVPANSGNGRFVSDASDYITYKRQSAINNNYNDLKNGGDQNHASYEAYKRVQA